MTASVPLTQGLFALVDDEDFERVSLHEWYAHKSRDTWYAETKIEGKAVKLHRFVLNLTEDDEDVDHDNGLGLDNQKANLRVGDCINAQNKGLRADNSSGTPGVYYKITGRGLKYWHAQITRDKKQRLIGRFLTKQEAVAARLQAEQEYGL